jgi:HEAT repeat protein
MQHSPVFRRAALRGLPWLLFLAVWLVLPAMAAAQDPVLEFKKILQTKPNIDITLNLEQQAEERKKFYDAREKKIAKLIESDLTSFSALRQALMLKDWRGLEKDEVGDKELIASDAKLRARIAEKFRARVRGVVNQGDETSQAAVANLITEMGLTVRGAPDPAKPTDSDEAERERNVGFARTLTDDIIKLGNSPSEFVRLHAVRALGGINADPKLAAAEFARRLAFVGNVKERRVAADGLLRLVTVAAFLNQSSLTKPAVRADRADALTAAAEVVRQAPAGLADKDVVVRARCAEALHASAMVLADVLKRTPDEGKPLPTPARTHFLPAEVAAIKDMLKLLDEAGPRFAAGLADPDVGVRLGLANALERIGDARYRLNEEPVTYGLPGKVLERVRLVPPNASDPLRTFAKGDWRAVAKLLTDADVNVRRTAVNFFEFFPDARPAVVPDLIRALSDSDRFVRWGAVRGLGQFSKKMVDGKEVDVYQPKDAAASVPAIAKLLFDDELNVRLAAAQTLEAIGPYAEAAVPDLARALHHGDPDFRIDALYALQRIGPERSKLAISAITGILDHPEPRVRRIVAETLGKFGPAANNKATVDALRHALGDDDQDTRINASEALLQILAPAPSEKK